MKFKVLFLVALSLLLTFPMSAIAQSQPTDGFGNIINEIFKGQIPSQGQQQGQRQEPLSFIDNIPVKVFFDARPQDLPNNAMLVITAFAAPPANVRRSSPLMLGETRILLDSLSAPLKLAIATPRAVTDKIDYARIEAKIIDSNGNAIFKLNTSGEYRGYEPAIARLVRIGDTTSPTPPTYPNIEPIHGTVTLNGSSPSFRGANLVVRLVEDSLAGGQNRIIATEQKFSLDQKHAPFDFKLDRGISSAHANTPLLFEVWIEDWAGRKTHQLPNPISYNGTSHSYRMRLEVVSDSGPTPPPQPAPDAQISVQGKARFNAYKGLPKGAVLIADLERSIGIVAGTPPRSFAQTRVTLDNLSGDVEFDISTLQTSLAQSLPHPEVRVRIEGPNGRVLFTTPTPRPLKHGLNIIELEPTASY